MKTSWSPWIVVKDSSVEITVLEMCGGICCLLITCHTQQSHHLGERVGVDLTLVESPVTSHHPGY